jgi:hypothetical protein
MFVIFLLYIYTFIEGLKNYILNKLNIKYEHTKIKDPNKIANSMRENFPKMCLLQSSMRSLVPTRYLSLNLRSFLR